MIVMTCAIDESHPYWKEWYDQIIKLVEEKQEVHVVYKIEDVDNILQVPDHMIVPDGVIIHYIEDIWEFSRDINRLAIEINVTDYLK